MLLCAVVQVPLDPPPLPVAGGHDPGPGLLQGDRLPADLVERLLQRGVEPDVVQGQPDLAGQVGEHAFLVGVEELRLVAALHHDQSEQLPGV